MNTIKLKSRVFTSLPKELQNWFISESAGTKTVDQLYTELNQKLLEHDINETIGRTNVHNQRKHVLQQIEAQEPTPAPSAEQVNEPSAEQVGKLESIANQLLSDSPIQSAGAEIQAIIQEKLNKHSNGEELLDTKELKELAGTLRQLQMIEAKEEKIKDKSKELWRQLRIKELQLNTREREIELTLDDIENQGPEDDEDQEPV